MKNRFILIATLVLVLLGGNYLSLWGQNWGSDFSIPNSSDGNSVPGGPSVREDWGKTFWFIPRYGNDPKFGAVCSFDENFTKTSDSIKPGMKTLEYTISEFENKDFIVIYYNSFEFEWNSYKKNQRDESGTIKELNLQWNLEWRPTSFVYWSPNPTDTDINSGALYTAKSEHDGFYDWVNTHEGRQIKIKTSQLWEKIENSREAMAQFNKQGFVDIEFRVVFYSDLTYRLENQHTKHLIKYFKTWNTIVLRISQCESGKLTVDNLPGLNGDCEKGYAICENRTTSIKATSEVKLTKEKSIVDHIIRLRGNLSYNDDCEYGNVINGKVSNDISARYMLLNGSGTSSSIAKVGDEFTLERNIYNKSNKLQCSSSSISLKLLPEPYLEGLELNEKEKIFCPSKKGMEVGNDIAYAYEQSPFGTLSGNRLDFKGFDEYESTYGVKYVWRYWTNRNSYHNEIKVKNGSDKVTSSNEIFDYNNDENGPDLIFPISALKPGVTYYFEQYVKLKNFENVTVEATVPEGSELKKFYTVRLSKSLDADKFNVEVSEKEACYGENLENVVFKADYDDSENYKEYGIKDEKGFKFTWSMDGKSGESYGAVREDRNFFPVKEQHCFNVSLADGCENTIQKEVCLEVHDLPEFTAENIICQSGNVSLTYETDEVSKEQYVLIKGMKGRQYDITITDEDKSSHNYYYSSNEDGTEPKRLTTYKEAISSKTLYIFKEAKNGYKCLSKPVKVVVADIEEIQGNEFRTASIYVCPESNVPALNSENITDPQMMNTEGVTFTYRWMYSTDNSSWKEMINTDAAGNEKRFTDKNYDGSWTGKVESDKKIYVRREVKAYLNGVEIGSHNSNSLMVTTFAQPNPAITLTAENTKATKCYGDVVKLSMTVNPTLMEQQRAMKTSCLSRYGYYDFDGKNYNEIETYDLNSVHTMEVKKNYVLHSGVEFCGSTVYSKTGVTVETYPNMDVTPSVSACKIVGQNVTIKAAAEDIECTIEGSNVSYPDKTDKSVATILLEKKQTYTYTVNLENIVTGCKSVVTKHIQNTEIKDKLEPKAIGPNGNAKEKVCAGVDVSLSSPTSDETYKRYAWSVDGVYIKNGNAATATYNFQLEGKDYEVVRECEYYEGSELCYTVLDKVTVSTYPKPAEPTLEVSALKICNGESITITATANGGGSESSAGYSIKLMPGSIVSPEKVEKGKSVEFNLSNLTKETSYYVVVTDNMCDANANYYNAQSEKSTVEVEKDLTFQITSTKSVITRDEFKDGVISVPVSLVGVEKGEIVHYTLNGENETKVTYTGSLAIDMEEALFEKNNSAILRVVRNGSVLSSCASDATKIFGVNDGFEGVPSITGNGQDQEIEVCGGAAVELAVENVDKMTFADDKITNMKNPTWTWFKDNSVVEKTTDPVYTVQAGAGKTNSYTVMFSGEDADGNKRKVSSYEFKVKGRSGIEVGRIAFGGDYSTQNFIEFCNNKESEQTISMTCELDPKNVDFTWKYSTTGAKDSWKDVPVTWNGKESTKSKVITVHVDSLVSNGGENYYFQVEAKDNCDNVSVTTSKNMLQVKIKKSIELPVVTLASPRIYSAADPLPTSLDFSRKYTHTNLYEFVGCGETKDLGGTTQRVSISDLKFGENSVDVVRTELARISNEECVSDTLRYTYNIYQKLATPKLGRSDETITCPNEKTPKYLTLNAISGGDPSSYEVTWLYRLDEASDWMKVNEGDNLGLFSAEIGDIIPSLGVNMQNISITKQTQSIIVRAIVSCDKDKYPGDYVSSNDVAMEVYTPLKDNGIDPSTQEICYNTAIDTIKGYEAEGGSGSYLYTWWSSEDNKNFEQIVKGEEGDPFFAPKNFNGAYNLKNTTYFKRIVTDKLCNTTLESEPKKVYVRESFNILAEDVDYSRIVTNDGRAELTGITDGYEYVWWKSETKEMEGQTAAHKSVLTEPLSVPAGDDFIMVTYYAQAVKDGCRSTNKLPMEIYVYNQTGGHIFFEDEEEKPNGYWICSEQSNVQILSDDYARNAEFMWYYIGADQKMNQIKGVGSDGKVGLAVTTPELNLDTTNLKLKNTSGSASSVLIFRKTTVQIEGKSEVLFSDTLKLNIVPTLQSVSDAVSVSLGQPLAGSIQIFPSSKRKDYCKGDMPDPVVGGLKEEDGLYELWNNYKNYFGPWLYDKSHKGGFLTYYEYSKDGGDWEKGTSYDFSELGEYAGRNNYSVPTLSGEMDGTYIVRRVLDDGCSTVASNNVILSLFDEILNPDTVDTYAFTPEMTNRISEKNAIRQGYEIGDSIVFVSRDMELANLVWFSDMSCTDTLMDGNRYCSLVLTEEVAEMMSTDGAYIYVKAKRGDCLGETVEIPFAYGTHSDGGEIYISDTIICKSDSYSDIVSIKKPNGYYIAPDHVAMQWTYGWQFKRNASDKAAWSMIEGETGEDLPADVINTLVEMSITENSPLLIRRVATNEKGRVRYSNVITLTHYDDLVPGELSLNTETNKFCIYDELGSVKATSSTGGSFDGLRGMIWQYDINGKGWREIECLDSLYLGYISYYIEDRSINNSVSVRCLYYDDCDTVESNHVDVVFFRENNVPKIYQNNDSCDASLVKLVVYKEDVKKTYHWSAIYIDPTDTTYTEKVIWNYVGDSNMIVRNSMPTSLYAIKSIDDETGCVSDYYYFNVDSLPELDQTTPVAPVAICDGSDLEIKGGDLSGGNGDKTFQWQVSVTGKADDFSDIVDATEADLNLASKFMRTGSYFRRIVTDMCDTDTSEVVYVGVRDKVSVSLEDLSFDDFKCPNGIFTAVIVATKDSLAASEFWTIGEDTVNVIGKNLQMAGFAGDSMEYAFIHYVTDTNGVTCQSDAVVKMAYNKPALVKGENVITTDNFTPCNESLAKIEGTKLGGAFPEQIKYTWYVNDVEQIGNFGKDIRFRAQDDMIVKRIADNGCVTDTSNILHLEGQMVFFYDYEAELAMEIVSDVADSSVTMNILGSKKFGEGYYFDGDGEMPNVSSNSIRLPYKYDTYKDTILEVYANQSYCVKPYAIKPLRGGVISFDGDSMICGSAGVPSIVVTELEGGLGNVTYQWQYRNVRTPDFINIDGATDKSYTPSAIDVATTYRRVATDGVYKSISNELTLSIRPLPSVAQIESGLSEETMKEMGLAYKRHEEYQWIPNGEVMEMSLVDSASNADRTYWQKSYDLSEWITESADNDSMIVSDTASVVYYRFIAESSCGADTSSYVRLFTADIDPITDEQIDWNKTDTFVCGNDSKLNYLRFSLATGSSAAAKTNDGYLYSYRVESDCEALAWQNGIALPEDTLMPSDFMVRISVFDFNGYRLSPSKLPSGNVTLYVTRHDTAHGLSVTRSVVLKVDALDVTFAMSIENDPLVRVGENITNQISQGDRVQFVPIVSSSNDGGEFSYKWVLEEPLNLDLAKIYGGRNGLDGLTSERESPSCYYYNGGRYPVSLTVSDGFCQMTVRDTSLYISESSLRSFNVSMSLEDDIYENVKDDYGLFFVSHDFIDVFPTLVTDMVTVRSTGRNDHEAVLVDDLGRTLQTVPFNGSVQISMEGYISGTYFIVVDGKERFKIVRK